MTGGTRLPSPGSGDGKTRYNGRGGRCPHPDSHLIAYRILELAKSGDVLTADGVPQKLVIWPDDVEGYGFEMRVWYWADFLSERLQKRRDDGKRETRGGYSDIEDICGDTKA